MLEKLGLFSARQAGEESTSIESSSATEVEEQLDESSLLINAPEPAQILMALVQLNDAVESLPMDLKEAYLEALERCPDLVATESDPMRFLRYSNYDPWLAADTVCWYWRARKLCLEERFHLPMDFTGKGAFECDDVEFLRHGSAVVLPEDASGRPVCHVDRRRLIGKVDPTDPRYAKWCRRSLFFQCHVTCLHPGSVLHGRMGIMVPLNGKWGMSKPHQKLAQALYMNRGFIGACSLVFTTRRHYFLDNLLPKVIGRIITAFRPSIHVLVLKNEQSTCNELAKYGFHKSGVPENLGGTWSFEAYEEVHKALQMPGTSLEYTKEGLRAVPPANDTTVAHGNVESPTDEPELITLPPRLDATKPPVVRSPASASANESPDSIEIAEDKQTRFPALIEYKRKKRIRVDET